jgi:hypothetical protein
MYILERINLLPFIYFCLYGRLYVHIFIGGKKFVINFSHIIPYIDVPLYISILETRNKSYTFYILVPVSTYIDISLYIIFCSRKIGHKPLHITASIDTSLYMFVLKRKNKSYTFHILLSIEIFLCTNYICRINRS